MCRKVAYLLVFLFLLIFPLSPVLFAEEDSGEEIFDPYLDVCRLGEKLIDEGRYGEARMAYGGIGIEMARALQSRVEKAVDAGEDEKAIELCEAYFNHFPYDDGNRMYTRIEEEIWFRVAGIFVDVLGRNRAEYKELYDVEREASFKINRIRLSEVIEVVRSFESSISRLIEGHSKTYSCGGALYPSGYIRNRDIEKTLTKLEENDASARNLLILLFRQLRAFGDRISDKEKTAFEETCARIIGLTEVEFEKVFIDYRRATGYKNSGDIRKFIETYPDLYGYTSEACAQLVKPFLKEGKIAEALARIEELDEVVGPHANVAAALLAVASAFDKREEKAEALDLYERIAARWPSDEAAAVALGRIADYCYEEGRQADALDIYRKMLAIPRIEHRKYSRWSGGYFAAPRYRLAEYYMKTGRYEEGLAHLENWWGATGGLRRLYRAPHDIQITEYRIHCLLKLGRTSEALETLEPWIFEDKGRLPISPRTLIFLIDACRETGRPGKFSKDMLGKLAKSRSEEDNRSLLFGVRQMIDYLDLVELAEKGSTGKLWGHLGEAGPWETNLETRSYYALRKGWKSIKAANLIESLGDTAKPFLLKKLDGRDKPEYAACILARMKVREIEPVLKERIEGPLSVDVNLRDYFHALIQLDAEPGIEYVYEWAANEKAEHHRAHARKVLDDIGILNDKWTFEDSLSFTLVPAIDFKDRPLEDLIEYLRTAVGVNVNVDYDAFGGDRDDIRFTLSLKNVTARQLLSLALSLLDLIYVEDDIGIIVTTEKGAKTLADPSEPLTGTLPERLSNILKALEIPIVDFDDADLAEVFEFLSSVTSFDFRIDPAVLESRTEESLRVNVRMDAIKAIDLFLLVLKLKRLRYAVDGEAESATIVIKLPEETE